MNARPVKRRADRPSHLMGISETRINMLKAKYILTGFGESCSA